MMTSSCYRAPEDSAATRAGVRQDAPSSPGQQLTKVLTNFSIDSIIHGPPSGTPLNSAELDGERQQKQQAKKFRPKNFQCPVCRMAFSNNGQLKNHVRIHTGERPFECNERGCNKTFTRNEELTRHKLIHTGVRPHACPSCCKSFGRKDHLKKHVRTHERKRARRRVYGVTAGATATSFVAAAAATPDPTGRHISDPVYSPTKAAGNLKRQARRQAASRAGAPSHTAAHQPVQRPAAAVPLPIHGFPSQFANFAPSSFLAQPPPPPPVTLAQHLRLMGGVGPDAAVRTMAAASLAVTSSLRSPAAFQQLAAGDYWHKWYSFLGLCQQQQQQQQHHQGLKRI